MELFWRQGYEATSLAELLDTMGIGRQSLYDTFGDKRSLYLEALRRYFEERASMARSTLAESGSPLGNLSRLFQMMMERSAEAGFCGCFVGNTLAEFGDRDPEVSEILTSFLDRIRAAFQETLERARELGELPPAAAPAQLAEVLLVTTQGLALLSKIQPHRELVRSVAHNSLSLIRAGR